MPSTGFKTTSTNPTITGVGSSWTNPNNAKGPPDGLTASTTISGSGSSTKIRLSGFSFGMPANAVPAAMIVRIKAKGGGAGS